MNVILLLSKRLKWDSKCGEQNSLRQVYDQSEFFTEGQLIKWIDVYTE